MMHYPHIFDLAVYTCVCLRATEIEIIADLRIFGLEVLSHLYLYL